MKKSLICIVAAIAVFVCSVLPVSADTGDVVYKRRIYPGREMSDYTGYKYGNYNLNVTLPAGSFSFNSDGTINIDSLNLTVSNGSDVITGTIENSDFYIDSDKSTYGYEGDVVAKQSYSDVNLKITNGSENILLNYGSASFDSISSGSMSFVFQGQLSFVRTYTWKPDYTKLSGCDELQIWTVNYGWNESLNGAKGTVTSTSFTVDGEGDKIELLDGYNNFYFTRPGSSMTVNTIVNFSVVVPEVSTEDFTFSVNLNSRVDDTVGDRWVLTPYQLYYDASGVLDGFKDIFDDYWSEDSSHKVNSGSVDLVVSDFDNIESQISDQAFIFIDEFDFNNASFESGGEDFLFATTWLSSMLMRMFAISFEFSTVFYVSMGLLLACILIGIRRFWR